MKFPSMHPGLRMLLVPLPTLAGITAWDRFNDRFLFESDWYAYLWYPPLMDLLAGLLVLGPFAIAQAFPLRLTGLVAVSVLAHAVAVSAVFHSQWALQWLPGVDSGPRFASVVPIGILVTLLLFFGAWTIGGCRPGAGYWRNGALAGLGAGLVFLVTMEVDSRTTSWLYEHGIPWMSWHAAICLGLYMGTERSPATAEQGA